MAWFSSLSARSARRHSAVLVTGTLLSSTFLATTAFAQPTADAKASIADGDKAARGKDWATAARSYDAANKAQPSADTLENLANAQYQAGQLGEAYASYTDWLAQYGAKAPPAKKSAAEARQKEIAGKTGAVTVTVNEAGATILADDKPVGTSPLAGPLRLTPGPHRIRVTKDGFLPFDQAPNVSLGGTSTVAVTLAASSAKGRITVKEKTGKPIRVTVDNVDMGEAPWAGDVDPGQHKVGARGTGLVAAPQEVTVERGKTQDVELAASSSSAPVKIGTSDGKGLIYLDDKLVGEGSFVSDIPAGPHKLKITREGYDPFEEEIVVKDKELLARTITLKLSSKIETGTAEDVDRLEGIYGGFSLAAMFTPGGTGNYVQKTLCEGSTRPAELTACDAPDGMGGGLGGFIGYHWNPVGIELLVAGQYDQRTMKTEWAASSLDPGVGPDPARNEEYNLRRAGGMGVARARVTLQGTHVRGSLALGAGLVRRVMFLERITSAPNGPERDLYISESTGYWSPVVSIEPSVMFRATRGIAIAVGLQVFLETPSSFLSGNPKGENPRTNAESNHQLGNSGPPLFAPRGLSTRSIDLASNLQVFVGPFIGMMFGP
jgi:hypothetical protein